MMPAIVKRLFAKNIVNEAKQLNNELIDNSKLDIKTARTFGGATYLALTGYLESGKKYVVQREIYNRNQKRLMKLVIQSVDDSKQMCQDWNSVNCKNCGLLSECELNKD